MPCCDECISTSHSKCTGIKSLAGIVEKTKIENSKESVETNINSILNLLGTLINNKSKNIKRGENQCVSIKQSIQGIRQEINKHLDHLEKKLCQETDIIWNQEKSKATDFISEIEREKKNLKEIKEHLQTVTRNTSKLQSFLGVHQIEQQVHQCQRYVEDLENDERTKEVDIKMKQNDEIEKVLSKLESLESLGEVTVKKTKVAINIDTSVRKELKLVPLPEQSNIENMTMNIETKFEININRTGDIICLMDGRVILVEWYGKVHLLSSDGKLQKLLPIPGEARCVTQINQYTIALTYPMYYDKYIKFFNMEKETVTKVIALDKGCLGLSFCNNSLAVGLNRDEIRIIDLEGKQLKTIQVKSDANLHNLVYCNDRVIYSDNAGEAVCCYDESGKQIWRYTPDLEVTELRGLSTDTYGNIFVADPFNHRIIVISKDGQKSKILMSENDGLKHSNCFYLKHNESSGFICDYEGKFLVKFNLSTSMR